MNKLTRLAFQIALWFGIWCFLWISGGSEPHFFKVNGSAFLIQIVLLIAAIYYVVPRFLFSKKYVIFSIISIGIVLLCAYLTVQISPPPAPLLEPPVGLPNGAPPKLPSRFFITVLILAISYILATLLETFVFAQKNEKDSAFAKAELKESELKFLKMQINPHFLFNALNNIYALSVIDSDKTQESISTLSNMLRYVIYDCEQAKVPLRKELDYIAAYMALFKLRNSKGFNISYTENVINDKIDLAPMLLVPFIENAFKHSGVEKGGDNFIHISLTQKGNVIDFSVENSIPDTPNSTDAQGGIGLPNVQKRLEMLYPESHSLAISKSKIFTVHLKLESE